jgi:hypothetical protein
MKARSTGLLMATSLIMLIGALVMATPGTSYADAKKEPFQRSIDISLSEGSPGTRETVFTVPEGRLLIIEFVSASIEIPQGQFLSVIIDVIKQGRVANFVFPLLERQSHSPEPGVIREVAGVNQLVRIFAEASAQVDVSTVRVPVTGTGGGSVVITGTLVEAH